MLRRFMTLDLFDALIFERRGNENLTYSRVQINIFKSNMLSLVEAKMCTCMVKFKCMYIDIYYIKGTFTF